MLAQSPSATRRSLAIAGVSLFVAGGTWAALSPRPDWHDAPIHWLPLRFRGHLGCAGPDTALHLGVAALLPMVVALIFATRRRVSTHLWLVGGTLFWLTLIELLQGFLPYRSLQLSDELANLAGCLLALTWLTITTPTLAGRHAAASRLSSPERVAGAKQLIAEAESRHGSSGLQNSAWGLPKK